MEKKVQHQRNEGSPRGRCHYFSSSRAWMASELFERVFFQVDELTARVATYSSLLTQCALSPQLAHPPLLEYEDGFSAKRQLRPLNLLMLELWNFGKWKERENLCLQQDRQTQNSEWNCQVYQSASSYTMGEKSLGFNQLPATASSLVITTTRTSRIYFLLKIHKHNNPGGPIVPACICPTELIYIHTYIHTNFIV